MLQYLISKCNYFANIFKITITFLTTMFFVYLKNKNNKLEIENSNLNSKLSNNEKIINVQNEVIKNVRKVRNTDISGTIDRMHKNLQ